MEALPERPISPHPNYVTARGLELIEAALSRCAVGPRRRASGADREALARQRANCTIGSSAAPARSSFRRRPDSETVHFGSTVTIERDDGRRQTWQIVGEDEADPAHGTLSYVSPVARALAGRKVGEVVQAGNYEAEIVAIE